MLVESPVVQKRNPLTRELRADLVIVGGGLAGTCCAVTAARAGLRVVLIQDRPVLGGNASSEIRLWILGATAHMGNNNRWSREGGLVDEILVENLYRNPEGNPLILDTILLEKVRDEANLTLLLNTAVYDLEKAGADTIRLVRAFCSQSSTAYVVTAPLFCDASGDGILGFVAGAAFRMGSESQAELGEKMAPIHATNDLLGHTIFFYSKDTGRPVKFVPPSYALKDITTVPRWRNFSFRHDGCRLWWIEWGGQLDTVHETEAIKWELWKVVYGVWNYIKNSGRFPEAESYTLEWVGNIPGKRESRRFEGDYLLCQQDIVEQRLHPDAVSYGGWAIDLHPAEGVFSAAPGCTQWHSKGIYQIPYRCMYSRNIANLFLTGRIISASHVAFGSSRVMATSAHNAQAVALAAVLCLKHGVAPRQVSNHMVELQRALLRAGQFIPGCALDDPEDLARDARWTASSELRLAELEPNGETVRLSSSWCMMLPLKPGAAPAFTFLVDANQPAVLRTELRVSSRPGNYTPDRTLDVIEVPLPAGAKQSVDLRFDALIEHTGYAFICLLKNDAVSVHLSDRRVTGVLALRHQVNHAVATSSTQTPPPNIGIDSFEFWQPQRRPAGKNFALKVSPAIEAFGVDNLRNGFARPTSQPNAWVASFEDREAVVDMAWPAPQRIARIELSFDTDFDHPMESVLMGHPERVVPFCVQHFEIRLPEKNPSLGAAEGRPQPALSLAGAAEGREAAATVCAAPPVSSEPSVERSGHVAAVVRDNHQSRRTVLFDPPLITDRLQVCLKAPAPNVPAALFEVRCYGQ